MNETELTSSHEPEQPKIDIAISATFVAEPVAVSLSAWLRELGIHAEVEFAPLNQVFQQLLSPASALSSNPSGIKVIFLRFSDWRQGYEPSKIGLEQPAKPDARARIDEFVAALSAAVQRNPATFLVFVCPEDPTRRQHWGRTEASDDLKLEDLLVQKAAALESVRIVTVGELESLYPVADRFDSSTEALASVPYTPIFYAALGTLLARKINMLVSPPYKVLLLDCDGTLWDGICGEDGPQGLRIDSGRRTLQECIVRQKSQGMLVCLCSKNSESDVFSVFDGRSDMILRRDHLAAWRINWRSKSDNIRSLSQELGLGLDSFIFIDDDPVECAEVLARCPEVLTLSLPGDPDSIPLFLKHVWAFDKDRISREDEDRTRLYREHFERENLRRGSPTLKEFLANLGLEVDVAPLLETDAARVSELTFRTNQFNSTARRQSVAEINNFFHKDKGDCLTVHAKDRFGDYGLVGAVFCRDHDNILSIDNFLLSCRALGRGVEHRLVARLGDMAQRHGLSHVDFHYVESGKNQPALDFLSAFPGAAPIVFQNRTVYRIDARDAAHTTYDPDAEHNPSNRENTVSAEPMTSHRPDSPRRALLLCSIPETLWDPALIHRWAAPSRSRSAADGDFVAPTTPTEVCIAGIFSELLGVDRIGLNDGFFHLGGHSLLAMQLLARINAALGVAIEPITLFTTSVTVAELVKAVHADQLRRLNPQDMDTLIESLSAITDDDTE